MEERIEEFDYEFKGSDLIDLTYFVLLFCNPCLVGITFPSNTPDVLFVRLWLSIFLLSNLFSANLQIQGIPNRFSSALPSETIHSSRFSSNFVWKYTAVVNMNWRWKNKIRTNISATVWQMRIEKRVTQVMSWGMTFPFDLIIKRPIGTQAYLMVDKNIR